MDKITTLPTANMDRPSTAFFWGRHAPLPSLTLVKLQAFHFLSQKGSSIETELHLQHIMFGTSFTQKFVCYDNFSLFQAHGQWDLSKKQACNKLGLQEKKERASFVRTLSSLSPACFSIVPIGHEVGAVSSESSKVCIQAKWLISLELILVSVA